MRWATYRSAGAPDDRVGVVRDRAIYALKPGAQRLDLLGDEGERLARGGERALVDPVEVVALASVTLRAPIPQPPSIRDLYAIEEHMATVRRRRGLEMEPD